MVVKCLAQEHNTTFLTCSPVVSNRKSKPQKAATKAKDNSTHSTRFNTLFPRSHTPGCTLCHVDDRCPNILQTLSTHRMSESP